MSAGIALVAGCATMPGPPAPEVRSQLGRVAVVALPGNPQGDFRTFAKGRAAGTALGAAGGAGYGLLYGLSEGAKGGGGPYAAAAATIAALVFTLVGTGTGAVIGHQTAIPAATATEIETRIDATLRGMRLSDGIAATLYGQARARPDLQAHHVTRAAPADSYAALAEQGVDTVFEVSVPAAGFRGGAGETPSIAFYMNAHVRFVHAGDNRERYARDFLYVSHARPFDQWFEDGAKVFAQEFERASERLAERILDESFLVTAFPFPSGMWAPPGDPAFATCWFRPIYPQRALRSLAQFMLHPQSLTPQRDLLLYPRVESLQPTLEWEPLPRPRDRTPEHGDVIARLSDVRYDLKIWEANQGFPERLVYDRAGLETPRHRLEYPLQPDTRYFWTFRARYRLDGAPQASRWAFSLAPVNPPMPPAGSCDLDGIPDPNYYRFATPTAGD